MSSKVSTDELLAKEMDQARAGTHQRQKGEEKRLLALKGTRIRRAEHLRQLRVDQVEAQFEAVRREVSDARRGANAHALTTAFVTPLSHPRRLCVVRRRKKSSTEKSPLCRTVCIRRWWRGSGARRPRWRT